MDSREATMRIKMKLKGRVSRPSEQQLSALRTAMSLIQNNELVCLADDQSNHDENYYKVRGTSFDHDLNTLEIILQKHHAG